MNSDFQLLNSAKQGISYISKQVINFPNSARVLKDNIEKDMYSLIECIFSYSIYKTERLREKCLRDVVLRLSMLDYYMQTAFEKKYISKGKYQSAAGFLIRVRKIAYGLIRSEKAS